MDIRRFQQDAGGAFVGALATLPQAVAYGLIAVTPLGADWAVFGITASIGSALLFGLLTGAFGSNPVLVSGPRAVTALVLATSIQAGLDRGLNEEVALLLAFCGVAFAGVFQMLSGAMRLGHLVSHVPVPVIVGFVNASALIVFFKSLPMVLGLPGFSMAEILQGHGGMLSWWALCVGGVTIVTNFALEGRFKIIPAALSGLILGTAVYHLGVMGGQVSGPVVGYIDLTQLLRWPFLLQDSLSIDLIRQYYDIPLLAGVSIGLLTSFDTVLSGSALLTYAQKISRTNYDLGIHGFSNILMGMFGFLPGSGALSRSSAMIKAGGRERGANIGLSLAFLFMLLVLAPLVAILPMWATSGMLVATAIQAVDRSTLDKVWGIVASKVPYPRVIAGDVIVTCVVVVTALTFDLIAAVGVGILLSVILFVLGMGRDPIRRAHTCARVHSKIQRNKNQMDFLDKEGHRIAVIELQGALFFGACNRLQLQVKEMLAQGVEYLILDVRHLTSIDSTGSATLRRLHLMCAEAGGQMMLSCLEPERRLSNGKKGKTREESRRLKGTTPRWIWLNMQANDVVSTISRKWIFDDSDSALAKCEEELLRRHGKTPRTTGRGIIAASSLFEGLQRTEISALSGYVKKWHFEKGDVVFEQADDGDEAFFLSRGRMDVLIDIPGSSRKKRVSVFSEGTLFGEMGLIDGEPRSATVKAVSPSVCFSISSQDLSRLENHYPQIVTILLRNLSRQFAHRLRIANNMISELEQ